MAKIPVIVGGTLFESSAEAERKLKLPKGGLAQAFEYGRETYRGYTIRQLTGQEVKEKAEQRPARPVATYSPGGFLLLPGYCKHSLGHRQ